MALAPQRGTRKNVLNFHRGFAKGGQEGTTTGQCEVRTTAALPKPSEWAAEQDGTESDTGSLGITRLARAAP